ncbi:phage holin family protein [Capnocytophaga sputigena]|uniref:phage holin family protein n=1 Tax=Capnocytophaga sputigena TaxID=1019 RepID=UPI00288B40CC|nr:phage holin family protein [Capnocytophaga sputigena]
MQFLKYFVYLIISATLIFLLCILNVGATIEGYSTAILAAFVLSCLNAYVRPLLDYLLMPIAELTFGLTMFLNSAIMVFLTSLIVGGFKVYGFYGALMFSACLLLAQNITITPFEQAIANKK